jgi:hypothetical protein
MARDLPIVLPADPLDAYGQLHDDLYVHPEEVHATSFL